MNKKFDLYFDTPTDNIGFTLLVGDKSDKVSMDSIWNGNLEADVESDSTFHVYKVKQNNE